MKSAPSLDFHEEKSHVDLKIKICYSLGHVLNDFCSSLWFTYLLVYFQYVLNMESTQAGALLLIGQIIDGLTTPLVGLGIGKGKGKTLCWKRPYKGWHIIGTICTILGFPALFLPCFGCEKYGQWGILLWYGTLVALAQIGWAIVQISHMALIPILAKTNNQRIEISSYKNAAAFVASVVVYTIAWLVFGLHTDTSSIGEGNSKEFYIISFLCHGLGIICSIVFWFGVTEEKQRDEVILASVDASPAGVNQPLSRWFRKREFYTNMIVFTCGRLFGNLAQVYLPMYLQVTLSLPPITLATVPMTLYVSGFFTSMLVRWIRDTLDPVVLLWSAITLGFISSAGIWFGEGYLYDTYLIYFIAVLFGASGSIMFIISLASTANLIGDDVKSSGFVYGVYSLSDKISNGLVVFVIQYIHPERDSPFCGEFYRWVLPIVCSVSLAIALSTQFPPVFTKRKGYKIEEMISVSTML